jgi:hypothetical protein
MATSVLDYIFRELAISYLHRYDLGQVKPEDLIATSTQSIADKDSDAFESGRKQKPAQQGKIQGNARLAAPDQTIMLMRTARQKGYEGDPCPVCGNLTLVRNGTCLKCDTCGSTTGCS